jgi:hypothetical protein
MMMDLTAIALTGVFVLAGLVVASSFASRAWAAWLDVRKLELARGGPVNDEPTAPFSGNRIELADLRERVRKLEAIAAGIDL